MVRQGRGHIVNTASLAGLGPAPLLAPYAMTKHAVVGLSSSLPIEAKRYGVRVSVLCPAVIVTPRRARLAWRIGRLFTGLAEKASERFVTIERRHRSP